MKNDLWIHKIFEQEYNSKDTSVNSKKLPAVYNFIHKNYITYEKIIFDIGGGKFNNIDNFFDNLYVYDPYNRSEEENIISINKCSNGNSDYVVISNVLNVIKEDSIKVKVLKQAYDSLKNNGILFIKIYEGNSTGIGKAVKNNQWQENKKNSEYLPIIKLVFENCYIKNGFIICKREDIM